MKVIKMAKRPYEPAIISHFYNSVSMEDLMVMSDEDTDKKINDYLDEYMDRWQKRNKGKNFPDISVSTMAMVRNKRTDYSKSPRIARK
jgi:hypothetical protein